MLKAKLKSLVSPALLRAFRKMWSVNADDAAAEARKLIDLLAEPQNHTEVEQYLARLVVGLVGEKPDLASWLEAIAVGSFELPVGKDYAYSGELKKRARYLARLMPMYIGPVEEARQKWAAEVAGTQEAMRLIASGALLKELRKNVAAKAALGPAWPLMVAVNDHCSNDEKRLLHRFGADPRLIALLAKFTKLTLKRFVARELKGDVGELDRAADWTRSLPPGADVRAYFSRTSAAERKPVASQSRSPESITQQILDGPYPSFLTREMFDNLSVAPSEPSPDDELFGAYVEPEPSLPWHLQIVMPPSRLSAQQLASETFAKGMRAVARERYRAELAGSDAPDVQTNDYRVQVWLRHWAKLGGGIPHEIPIRYLGWLEEEACLAFETQGEAWPGTRRWRGYGLIGDPSRVQPANLPDYWSFDPRMSWIARPRKIDRIDVMTADGLDQDGD